MKDDGQSCAENCRVAMCEPPDFFDVGISRSARTSVTIVVKNVRGGMKIGQLVGGSQSRILDWQKGSERIDQLPFGISVNGRHALEHPLFVLFFEPNLLIDD